MFNVMIFYTVNLCVDFIVDHISTLFSSFSLVQSELCWVVSLCTRL